MASPPVVPALAAKLACIWVDSLGRGGGREEGGSANQCNARQKPPPVTRGRRSAPHLQRQQDDNARKTQPGIKRIAQTEA